MALITNPMNTLGSISIQTINNTIEHIFTVLIVSNLNVIDKQLIHFIVPFFLHLYYSIDF
jgi:hypothetical protein